MPPVSPPALEAADAAILDRVQRDNQRQILGKLLHDLRNPVHSIRISMELFGRLARRSGDHDKLMERAAAYIEPAEAALQNLLANSERLGRYLAAPVAPQIGPVATELLLTEIALLLRGSRHGLHVGIEGATNAAPLQIRADRVRLGHVLLHRCLYNTAAGIALSAAPAGDDVVRIAVALQGDGGNAPGAAPLGTAELRLLVEAAGGTVEDANDSGLSLRFSCWRGSPPAG